MAGGRHRRRRKRVLNYGGRERAMVGSLVVAMVVGHLFILALTVQSLRSTPPLRSDHGNSSPSLLKSDAQPVASNPELVGAAKAAP